MTYHQTGDYLIPDLEAPEAPRIGKYGTIADLDNDHCVCYRSSEKNDDGPQVGDEFSFTEALTRYANEVVADGYREGFLDFIDIDHIRSGLEKERILVHRYLVLRNGVESYEMLRIAGVRQAEERTDHAVHAIGLGFADIDAGMRE